MSKNKDDDFVDFMIIQNMMNGDKRGSSSGGCSSGGCFTAIVIVGIIILLIAIGSSCLGCSGSSYSSSGYSSSSSSRSSSSTSKPSKSTSGSYSGKLSKILKEGNYVSDGDLAKMKWQGQDNRTCSVKTTKYRYDEGDYTYIIWVNKDNKIMKVSLSLHGDALRQYNSTTRSTSSRNEFDVDDFVNPEDFYDWYKDDFVDFEEAEDYYHEHKN